MNYGRAVRVARAIAGLSQKQLAIRARLDPSHVSLIEKGARKPSTAALAKICDALEMPAHLVSLLAAEQHDLRGIQPEEFSRIAHSLTSLLLTHARNSKGRKAGRRSR